MLQSQWTDKGISLRDVEPPALRADWVRLRVAACGICGSDLHIYRHGGRETSTPGHEVVGTILEAQSGLADTLYAAEPWLACDACGVCLSGERQNCPSGALLGVDLAGGLAEFVDVPAKQIYPLDPSISPLVASMAEPLAVCVRAIHRAQLKLDSRVLVIGAGTIGLLTGMLARDSAGVVAIGTRHEHQREAATKLGLQPVSEADVTAFAREFRPDVVFESVGGTAPTIGQSIEACRTGGRIVVLGLFSGPSEIDGRAIMLKELMIVGSKVYGIGDHGHEFRAATQLVPRYRRELAGLQTHQYPLGSIEEAFACAADKSTHAIKVTILM